MFMISRLNEKDIPRLESPEILIGGLSSVILIIGPPNEICQITVN